MSEKDAIDTGWRLWDASVGPTVRPCRFYGHYELSADGRKKWFPNDDIPLEPHIQHALNEGIKVPTDWLMQHVDIQMARTRGAH